MEAVTGEPSELLVGSGAVGKEVMSDGRGAVPEGTGVIPVLPVPTPVEEADVELEKVIGNPDDPELIPDDAVTPVDSETVMVVGAPVRVRDDVERGDVQGIDDAPVPPVEIPVPMDPPLYDV